MEYEKFLVSLYVNNNPLPQMFVTFDKRSDKLFVSVKQNNFQKGVLIIYDFKRFIYFDVNSFNDEFILDLSLNKETSFVIMYFSTLSYLGKNGTVTLTKALINKFNKVYDKILSNKKFKEEMEYDPNLIVENMSLKLFGRLNLEYYEASKKRILEIFALGKRAESFENKFEHSKFVSLGKGDDRIIIGVINKNNVPHSILMAFERDSDVLDNYDDVKDTKYISNDGKLWCFVARRASDGDIL